MNEPKNEKFDYSTERISMREKVAYGLGGFMDGGGVTLMSCIMMAYMTKVAGIAMGIASTIMTVAKIWDAFTDPMMGFISDNCTSKFGRRKPFMIGGAVALIFALCFLFMPLRSWGVSAGGMIPYILIMYLVWNTSSTVTMIPYCSMSSDISPSYKERNSANTVKLIFTSIASGLAYIIPFVLIEALISEKGFMFVPNISPVTFWLAVTIIFGTLFGGGLIVCGIFVKERVKGTGEKVKFNAKRFVQNYVEPMRNKSYRAHILMYVSAFTCMDIISALAIYYATDVWHGYQLFGLNMSSLFIVAPMMISCVIMFPIARIVMNKKSKQFAFRMGLPFYIIGGIMLACMDPSWANPILVPIAAVIMGLGFGGAQMMPWIIFPDTLDVAYMATGKKQAGAYGGLMTLARKVSGAFGVGLVGWILGGLGYLENKSDDPTLYVPQNSKVLVGIRLVFGISIVVLVSVALFASLRYKITNKKLDRVAFFSNAYENGLPLSDEEKLEREQLITELYGKDEWILSEEGTSNENEELASADEVDEVANANDE